MNFLPLGVATLALVASASPAMAAGDLLVAPTRVILDGGRGTEVILNNVGVQPATYRISLELRRMKADGTVEDVTPESANAKEKAILAMLTYAPRRVVLPPNQPQAIRIGARFAADLPDGEYRAHMLFRAIPDAQPPVPEGANQGGLSIALTPIYGVTIPVIVRKGALKASASISAVRLTQNVDGPALSMTLARSGERSTYGRIRVSKGGKTLYEAGGIAVYAEVAQRSVALPVPPALAPALTGAVKVEYLEDTAVGGGLIAETQAVLN
jgi:P pilus assembly chaperone PapD